MSKTETIVNTVQSGDWPGGSRMSLEQIGSPDTGIYFTMNGPDLRDFGGSVSSDAASRSSWIILLTHSTLRGFGVGPWWLVSG
jgi:hypothetical protein